jgi:hypothetical protein
MIDPGVWALALSGTALIRDVTLTGNNCFMC